MGLMPSIFSVTHCATGLKLQVTNADFSIYMYTAVLLFSLWQTYWSWKTWGIRFIGKVGEVIAADTAKEKNGTKSEKNYM